MRRNIDEQKWKPVRPFYIRRAYPLWNSRTKGYRQYAANELIPKLKRLCTEILEPIRDHFGVPFRPNSGFRSEKLNREIGGSSRSQHCLGEAVDIEIPGVSNFDLAQWINENLEFDQLILECYRPGEPKSGWVHVSLKAEGDENRMAALTYSNRTYIEGLMAWSTVTNAWARTTDSDAPLADQTRKAFEGRPGLILSL